MRNEYQKIFSKISTWVLIVLGLLLIVGIHLLFRSNGTNMDIQYSQFSKESIQQQKQYYRSQTSPDYQIELDLYDFIEENDLYTTKEFQLENSWMYLAINEAFYEKQAQLSEASLSSEQRTEIQTELEELKQSVRERDYKKYCEYKQKEIAHMDITDEEKKEVGFAYQYAMDHEWNPDASLAELIESYTRNQKTRFQLEAEKETDSKYYQTVMEEIQIEKYRLENNKIHVISEDSGRYYYEEDRWNMMDTSLSIMTALSMFVVILAGGSIAGEFSNGTIKFLLINPISRRKIFFSKYLTLLSISAIFTVLLYLIQLGFATFLFDGDWNTSYITVQNGVIQEQSAAIFFLTRYAIKAVDLVVMMTMAFMISSILRTSSVAIGLGVGALLAGKTITQFLILTNVDWGRYLIFANTDLEVIKSGTMIFPEQTVTFAIGIIAVYMIVFLLTAYDGFVRKDVC